MLYPVVVFVCKPTMFIGFIWCVNIMKVKFVFLTVCSILLAGCLSEFPGKSFGEEIGVNANSYELLMEVNEANLTIDFFILNTDDNLTHGINVYTMTETNYDNFVECNAYMTIEELSWENVTQGYETHEITANQSGGDSWKYVVADNGHCSPDEVRQDIMLSWTVSWPPAES